MRAIVRIRLDVGSFQCRQRVLLSDRTRSVVRVHDRHAEDPLAKARRNAELLEKCAQIYYYAISTGRDVTLLPPNMQELMGRIVRGSPLTAVAIGGIDKSNLADVLRHGAMNYCVLRAVNRDPDPKSAILTLQAIWREHCRQT